MERKRRVAIAALLMLSIGNFFRLKGHETIRAVEFLTIFAIGALSGLLLHELFTRFRAKRN